MTKHLVLGAARSGKSSHAEQLAKATGKPCVYIATATAGDAEMAQRIEQHQQQRQNERWLLVEEPLHLATAMQPYNKPDYCILVDCLTLWLSNCLLADCWQEQKTQWLATLVNTHADVIMVGNEVGSGIVPMGALSRQFVDENGWLHQTLAQHCDHVRLVVAGLPLALK